MNYGNIYIESKVCAIKGDSMKHYEVVCALIENEEGNVFCCKRGPGRALMGKWEFPGGKVEKEEIHEETIVREIREELKSEILPIKYIGSSSYEYHHIEPFDDFGITLYAYKCKLIKGNLTLTEHTDYKWASKEEMKKMDFAEADKPFISCLD